MPRNIQPVQVVTYKKKIVYKRPENAQKTFFDTFAGLFLINILSVVVAISTAGVGSSLVAGLGLSQLSQAVASTTIQTMVNFSITTTFDAITNHLTVDNLLFNVLFSITDVGKLGRAMKEDKLIKLLNNSNLLAEVGFNGKLKNFYQLQQHLKLKDVILGNKTKIAFKSTINDAELLQSIFVIADSTLKKEIKALTADQLKTLIDIEKVIYKINPNLLSKATNLNLKNINEILKTQLDINLNDFLMLDNLEVVNAFIKLQGSELSQKTLANLNLMRMQSKFQRDLLDIFKDQWKNLKNTSKKLNPFYWADKLLKKINEPMMLLLEDIKNFSAKYLENVPSIVQKTIKKYNLIPCQPESFLLGFSFEPIGLDGTGYITIYKKPYSWKTASRISLYNPVRVWTNALEVQKFATAKSQNEFYLENWALGFGFRQANLKALKLLGPRVTKIINEINKFEGMLKATTILLKTNILTTIKSVNYSKNINRIANKRLNNTLAKVFGLIPLGGMFTSTLIKSFRNQKWNQSWIRDDSAKIIKRKVIRKVVQING